MDDQAIKNEIVYTMDRKRVAGSHKKQVATLVGMALPVHLKDRGKELVDDLVQVGVVQRYGGGHRRNVRLCSLDAGISYLESSDGEVPFGFD